jgi:hypothetical protein
MPKSILTVEIVNRAAVVAERLIIEADNEKENHGRARCLRARALLMIQAIEQYRDGEILIPAAVVQLVNADAYLRWFNVRYIDTDMVGKEEPEK